MKIALVTPYDYPYPGGVTEHIRHLDREFRARGHETRIIAPSTTPSETLPANVIPVSEDILPIHGNGSTARINLSPEAAHRVKGILEREHFDIIHLHEPEVPLLGWAVLHASHTVNVGTFHAYSEKHDWEQFPQPLMAWVQSHLDGRIFVSPAVEEMLSNYAPAGSRVIPNGIDYEYFANPALAPIQEFADGRSNILFVGRLDERKGFRHLLQAYPSVKQAIPDARLLVVGAFSEPEQGPFVEYVRAHDLRDVHFVGRVSAEDLARYYRTATLFCAPSTGGESFGIILLEAMAAGLPVVASDIAGYRSVMSDNLDGRLVPPPATARRLLMTSSRYCANRPSGPVWLSMAATLLRAMIGIWSPRVCSITTKKQCKRASRRAPWKPIPIIPVSEQSRLGCGQDQTARAGGALPLGKSLPRREVLNRNLIL